MELRIRKINRDITEAVHQLQGRDKCIVFERSTENPDFHGFRIRQVHAGISPIVYHWPEQGLYLYASTQAVLDAAVFKIRKLLSGSMQKIPVEEGEILRLSPDGSRASETFSMKKLYQFQLCQSPYYGSCWPDVQDNTGYAEELRRMAPVFGFSAKDVDTLLRGGMLPEEIEEYFYCTEGREDVWFGMCSDS